MCLIFYPVVVVALASDVHMPSWKSQHHVSCKKSSVHLTKLRDGSRLLPQQTISKRWTYTNNTNAFVSSFYKFSTTKVACGPPHIFESVYAGWANEQQKRP
jgi:hypothetical protein